MSSCSDECLCLVGCRRLGTALKIAGLATDCECGPSVGTDQVCPGPGEADQAPGMEREPVSVASVSSDQTGAGGPMYQCIMQTPS